MLVVTRKAGQRILVGDDIVIKIMKVEGNQVSIGVEAPPNVSIDREEVRSRKLSDRGQRASAGHDFMESCAHDNCHICLRPRDEHTP